MGKIGFWGLSTILLVAAASASAANEAEFLEPHNKVRAEVGLPPLTWDPSVAEYAESYAEKRRGDCALEHSAQDATSGYGENISWGGDPNWSAADAVKAWADEKKFYDPETNACVGGECGHYTQIVWRDTARIGCARVECDKEAGVFITSNYDLPGNYIGSRPY